MFDIRQILDGLLIPPLIEIIVNYIPSETFYIHKLLPITQFSIPDRGAPNCAIVLTVHRLSFTVRPDYFPFGKWTFDCSAICNDDNKFLEFRSVSLDYIVNGKKIPVPLIDWEPFN